MKIMVIPGKVPFCGYILLYFKNWPEIVLNFYIRAEESK